LKLLSSLQWCKPGWNSRRHSGGSRWRLCGMRGVGCRCGMV